MYRPFFLILFFFSPLLLSQSYNKDLDAFLSKYYKNKAVPSISAGVSEKGKITWLDAEGYADIENNVPATPRTLYRIASISKSMTAVAVMQLFEQKKISLDDDIRKYLPWFPKKKWSFTVRQLLSHTAGIRNYRANEFDSKTSFRNIRETIEYIAQDSLEFEPGTNFLYTTLGYNLLAGIIESVSGKNYPDYMNQNIFQPAGMTNTIFDYHSVIIKNRARGYVKNAYREIANAPLADLSIKFPGGGVLSTAEDVLKFGNALMYEILLKKESIDTMLVPTILKSGRTISYALGFTSDVDLEGRRYFHHSGGGTGFTSEMLIYPDYKIVACNITNIRDRHLENPSYLFVKVILDKKNIVPKISLSDRMMNVYLSGGVDSAIVIYNRLNADSSEFFSTGFEEMNNFGRDLLGLARNTDAIKAYKLFLNEYPNNPVLLIGLGDAYFRDGNKGLALKNYRSAVNFDPNNKYASDMVRRLEKQ